MGDMLVELMPSMLGLIITPAAIAAGILLLGTSRPFANALSFVAGFAAVYSIISVIVVSVAATRTEPLLTTKTKGIIEIVVGLVLLGLAVVTIRGRHQRPAREAKKGFLSRLSDATPPFAFGAGATLATLNPNIPILIAGLAVVAASDTGHVIGAVLLVLASVLGILMALLWRLLMPETAARYLERVKLWIGAHERAINVAMLVVFGTAFVVKGLAAV